MDKGLKMTDQRRIIAQVLSDSSDHPDVESVHRRSTEIDPRISIATVYRTVRLFEEANILNRHDFGDGRARYEETPDEHHDHLIDMESGRVIEFHNEEIEALQERIAASLGFKLVGHRLELYGVPRPREEALSRKSMTAATTPAHPTPEETGRRPAMGCRGLVHPVRHDGGAPRPDGGGDRRLPGSSLPCLL
jgi:Fur family ferric uptake transcriptional regulator